MTEDVEHMRVLCGLICLLMLCGLAHAEDDAMEMQRCIWRCGSSTGMEQPGYDACIAKQCGSGEPTQATPSSQQGRWNYGKDESLRLSASIKTPDGTLGLACAYDGDSLAVADVVAIRVTPGLAQGNEIHYLFDGAPEGGTIKFADDVGYMEYKSDTCSTHVQSFQKARAFFILEGKILSLASEGGVNVFTVEQDGEQFEVRGFEEAASRLKGRSIPLSGSSAAIRQLLANCPAAQRDIDINCGF